MTLYNSWKSYYSSDQTIYLDRDNIADCTDCIRISEDASIFGNSHIGTYAYDAPGASLIATETDLRSFIDVIAYSIPALKEAF